MAETVNRDEVQTLVRNGAQLVEVLGPKEYRYAHLPQAINIPLADLNRESAAGLIQGRIAVVYCHDFQ
jgi:rhodanese-related sulfurtransferase